MAEEEKGKKKKGLLGKGNLKAKIKAKIIMVVVPVVLIAMILPALWYVISEGIGAALEGIVEGFENLSKLLFISDEGAIEITDEEVDEFIKEMEGTGIVFEQLGIPAAKKREYIKTFMLAYLVTQTPNAHVNNGQNGAICIQRHNAREDTIVDMTYIKELTEESGSDKFSLNEDGDIIYLGANNEICTIEDTKYEKYSMPTMFFIELCIITQNPNYVKALAQEVIDNTKIVMVLEESEYVTTETTVNVKTILDSNGQVIKQMPTETTETRTTKSIVPMVIEVDELLYSRTQTYNRKENVGNSSTRTEIISEGNPMEFNRITTQTTSYTFERGVEQDLVVKYEKDDPFPKLTKTEYYVPTSGTRKSAYDSITSGAKVMFENMDKHMDNESLIQILKYVLHMMTGEDYGVKNVKGLFSLNASLNIVGVDFIVDTEQCEEELIVKDVNKLKKALADYNSTLASYAQEYIDMQQKYHVNALFAASVSIIETSGGTAGNAINGRNNWYNIIANTESGWAEYSSPKESIYAFGSLIRTDGPYFSSNRYTVDTIAHTYCPNTPDYPTQGDDWSKNVIAQMTYFYSVLGINVNKNDIISDALQENIVTVATNSASYGISAERGYCLAWAWAVYNKAGAPVYNSCCCARHAGYYYGVSEDWSKIPVGAMVYGRSAATSKDGRLYGHVGIYVGNNTVVHNIGHVATDSLSDWINNYRGAGWGWGSTTPILPEYPVQSGALKILLDTAHTSGVVVSPR